MAGAYREVARVVSHVVDAVGTIMLSERVLKSWSNAYGEDVQYTWPSLLKLSTISFFLVSTLMMGIPSSRQALLAVSIFTNWASLSFASRSGKPLTKDIRLNPAAASICLTM